MTSLPLFESAPAASTDGARLAVSDIRFVECYGEKAMAWTCPHCDGEVTGGWHDETPETVAADPACAACRAAFSGVSMGAWRRAQADARREEANALRTEVALARQEAAAAQAAWASDVAEWKEWLLGAEQARDGWKQRAEQAESALTAAQAEIRRMRTALQDADDEAEQDIHALIAEVRRLREQAEGQYCPFCWEQAKDGHTADCALAALLAQEKQGG